MLQKNNTNKIMKIFFENSTKRFQLRELARISKISTTGVKSALLELLDGGLITKTKEKKYEYYETNRNDVNYKIVKKFFNVKSLYETGLVDHLEKELNHPEAIFLFGSSAWGEDVERSDVDIFALASVKKDLDLSVFSKRLKREIKLLIMNKDEFRKAKDKNPELINNIVNGVNLIGFLEVI